MSKTAKKKIAKKPRVFRSVDEVKKAYFPKKYAEDMKALNDKIDLLDSRLRTLNAWETMQNAMEEARSAPAEEWVPKAGDWVVVTGECGQGGSRRFIGVMGQIECEWPNSFINPAWIVTGTESWFAKSSIRPATEAEIASHKAKEEQRAKDDERAKEMAAPLEFGMKVRTTQGNGFVHGVYGDGCTHPTGRWWIAFPHNVLNHYARKDITIID